jgi:pyruvate kinase
VVELGWLRPGQRVGITAGLPSGRPGTTSLFQVQELTDPGLSVRRRRD